MQTPPPSTVSPRFVGLGVALALSLAAAVSLGLTRFAYGLLLPVMRQDLNWSYALAGGMNTANAAGYLIGALATPWLIRRMGAHRLLAWGAALATLFMAASGFFTGPTALMAQRLLAGITSAFVFVTGGLLAAQWASAINAQRPGRAGLLLGLYYGGTGWGIALSALGVPLFIAAAGAAPHAWQWAWWGLALVCATATLALAWPLAALNRVERETAENESKTEGQKEGQKALSKSEQTTPTEVNTPRPIPWSRMAFALVGYMGFGVGYIGYMTFVIALLREQGVPPTGITLFYALLGLAVVASARIWAGLLDRAQGGGALATLNALLGVATVLPALTSAWPVVLLSGVMFGAVFLSVVASTTAFVRHNLPTAQWATGISAFTIIFAAGQIVGPTVVGFIADGPGGLSRGLVFSACALWLGALLAWRQQPLPRMPN